MEIKKDIFRCIVITLLYPISFTFSGFMKKKEMTSLLLMSCIITGEGREIGLHSWSNEDRSVGRMTVNPISPFSGFRPFTPNRPIHEKTEFSVNYLV